MLIAIYENGRVVNLVSVDEYLMMNVTTKGEAVICSKL